MFSGGSINGTRAAHGGLSSKDPPEPAVPSPLYVNHLYFGIQRKIHQQALGGCLQPKKTRKILRNLQNSHIQFQCFLSLSGETNTVLQQWKHLLESKQTDKAVKGTFDRWRRKSKVACCQTPEPSSKEICSSPQLHSQIIPRNDSIEGTENLQSESPTERH